MWGSSTNWVWSNRKFTLQQLQQRNSSWKFVVLSALESRIKSAGPLVASHCLSNFSIWLWPMILRKTKTLQSCHATIMSLYRSPQPPHACGQMVGSFPGRSQMGGASRSLVAFCQTKEASIPQILKIGVASRNTASTSTCDFAKNNCRLYSIVSTQKSLPPRKLKACLEIGHEVFRMFLMLWLSPTLNPRLKTCLLQKLNSAEVLPNH